MPNLRITWNQPTRIAYSVMANILPGAVWQIPQNDYEIVGYRVQYRRTEDRQWLEAGTTKATSIEVANVFDGVYQARIATIDVAGRSGSWIASGEIGTIINFIARFGEPNHTIALGII